MKDGDLKQGDLTKRMDVGTQGFEDFQAMLLRKAKKRSEAEIQNINLLALKFEMEDYLKSTEVSEKSVGEFLKYFLKSLNIQQKKFAEYIGMKPSNLSKLIKGERSINYDLALIFGQLFNHDPMLWIEIHAKNELSRLQRAEKRDYSTYSLNDLIETPKKAG